VQVEREASIAYTSRRLPAWCDRILWHSNLPEHMRPRCSRYFMAAEVDTSDHKPVGGIFVIPSVNSPAQVVSDSTDSAHPPLHPYSVALSLIMLPYFAASTDSSFSSSFFAVLFELRAPSREHEDNAILRPVTDSRSAILLPCAFIRISMYASCA
jgi:hypothetical protein